MALRLALAAALALLAVPAPVPEAPCVQALCGAAALEPFLAEREAGHGQLHILQIGDSHTAGDNITGAWRRRLQDAHGHAGRGVLAAGSPYRGYLTREVTAAQSEGWSVNAAFGPAFAAEGPPLGLSGFTQTAHAAGERLWLNADPRTIGFDRLTVCAIEQPDGGALRLQIGNQDLLWNLGARRRRAACRTLDSDAFTGNASVEIVREGMVSITSFAVFGTGPGIVLSNLGVPGAQLQHLARMSDEVIAAELRAWQPDLIVLAFGTNEGFSPALSADQVEASLRTQIARIRRLAEREVPILLLGAPDAATRRPSEFPRLSCGDGWYVPALLEEVRARQAATARQLGLAYWDWAAAMGGRCAASRWVASGDMRADHVHFTRSGGERIGAMLDAAFTRAAERVR
jgi:lysophospholipase L1-like esterase